jgi:hypothetical protein
LVRFAQIISRGELRDYYLYIINKMRGYLLLFILLTAFLIYALRGSLEGFTGEAAAQLIPPADLQAGQALFNPTMQILDPRNPALPINAETKTALESAFNTYISPDIVGSTEAQQSQQINIPDGPSVSAARAAACEAVTSTNCAAFDDPTFAAHCGISFDKKGTDSKGRPHMGGMYYRPGTTRPFLATADPAKFVTTKAACIKLGEEIGCEEKQTFETTNCAQCSSTGRFTRIDPATPRLTPELRLQGKGTLTLAGKTYELNPTQTTTVPLTNMKEADTLALSVTGSAIDCYIAGYLKADTAAGPYKVDINGLISTDTLTGYKPRQGGSQRVDDMNCVILRPANGSATMTLSGLLPYTFISVSEADAANCDNGPFITQAASAAFLESDPCYKKGAEPGKYSTECLRQKFVQVGGTTRGEGYPSTDEKARKLLFKADGSARTLGELSDYLYDMAIVASTGRNRQGTMVPREEWHAASMFMLAVPVLTPCGPNPGSQPGPLARECLKFLYDNAGKGTEVGATYSMDSTYASGQTYCKPGAPLDPTTDAGLQRGRAAGNLAAVKNLYDSTHRLANDNSAAIDARRQAIKDCYGVEPGPTLGLTTPSAPTCAKWRITTGGYEDATGGGAGNLYCFSNKSLTDAQKECCGQPGCVGFSYNAPTGGGCMKRNTQLGFITNPSYQGFYKV